MPRKGECVKADTMKAGKRGRRCAALAALVLLAVTGPALAADYQAGLGPMPLDDETRAVIAGRGQATASYDGKTLVVKGSFRDMPSAATVAGIHVSTVAGMAGARILPLNVTQDTSGTITGSFVLTRAQAAALRTGKLYIQINSQKAPPGYPWGPARHAVGLAVSGPCAGRPRRAPTGPLVPSPDRHAIPLISQPSSRSSDNA